MEISPHNMTTLKQTFEMYVIFKYEYPTYFGELVKVKNFIFKFIQIYHYKEIL